jgi:hypothetical protein
VPCQFAAIALPSCLHSTAGLTGWLTCAALQGRPYTNALQMNDYTVDVPLTEQGEQQLQQWRRHFYGRSSNSMIGYVPVRCQQLCCTSLSRTAR